MNNVILFVLIFLIISSIIVNLFKPEIPNRLGKMYIINLDRRPDRLSIVKKNLERNGYNNLTRYKAVDSSEFTRDDIEKVTILSARNPIYDNYRTKHEQLSKGAVGCYLSHVNLWKKMIDDGDTKITIFEDDTKPTISRERLQGIIEKVPEDWDMIIFGGIYNEGYKVYSDIYKLKQFYCMHAYMIKNSDNIKKIISECLPIEKQIDSYLSDLAKNGKINIYGIKTDPMWMQDPKINNTDIQTPVKIEK